jgi:hypothetical protein
VSATSAREQTRFSLHPAVLTSGRTSDYEAMSKQERSGGKQEMWSPTVPAGNSTHARGSISGKANPDQIPIDPL